MTTDDVLRSGRRSAHRANPPPPSRSLSPTSSAAPLSARGRRRGGFYSSPPSQRRGTGSRFNPPGVLPRSRRPQGVEASEEERAPLQQPPPSASPCRRARSQYRSARAGGDSGCPTPPMEHRHKIRPVQLFAPSSSNPNTLRLNKSALNAVLGHSSIANRKIVVICVSGANRKGKSFLLNFFLEYLYILQYSQKVVYNTRSLSYNRASAIQNDMDMDWLQDETQLEGFHFRPGAKRDTMDTQGCFEQPSLSAMSASASQQHIHHQQQQPSASSVINLPLMPMSPSASSPSHHGAAPGDAGAASAVLVLSTLLSGIQLFNVGEYIPEEAFQLLAYFTDYARLAAAEALQLGKPFQRLVLLVRDSKVSEEMVYGIDGGSKMLERVLRSEPQCAGSGVVHQGSAQRKSSLTASGQLKPFLNAPWAVGAWGDPAGQLQRQLVKEQIKQCFEYGLSCYLLPSPGPKIVEGTSFKGQVKDVKALFRDEVRRVVECMIGPDLIKPKMLNGKEVTVRKFIECVKEYAKIFEAPEVPDARSVLNANLQLACVDYALEAKLAYCRGMDRVTRSSRMMAEKKLLEAHIKHGIKALNIYDRCPKIDSGDVRSRNLARLQESINNELERYKKLNVEKRVTTCASAMLACGDSALFGLGLGGATTGAVAATVLSLQMGIVSAGIVAIPVSLGALLGIWVYVTLKPTVRVCLGLERD